MTNAERQRKWIAKNRALHNLRRRNKRKNLSGNVVDPALAEKSCGTSETTLPTQPSVPFETKKVGEFRMLVVDSGKPEAVLDHRDNLGMDVAKPVVRRSETGMVISEEQWQKREEYKRQSKERGFEPDEYSQT